MQMKKMIVFTTTCIFQLEGVRNRVKLDLAVKETQPQISMTVHHFKLRVTVTGFCNDPADLLCLKNCIISLLSYLCL